MYPPSNVFMEQSSGEPTRSQGQAQDSIDSSASRHIRQAPSNASGLVAGAVTVSNASISPSQMVGTGSATSPSASSRTSGRSRRGCHTCRKRYESQAPESYCTPAKQQRTQQNPGRPGQGNSSPVPNYERSRPQRGDPAAEPHQGVNTSRAQSVGYDSGNMQEYDTSMVGDIMPSMNYDEPMGGQGLPQRLLGQNIWELELLGEDSLWANLPILSNFMSVQDPEPYDYVSGYTVPSSSDTSTVSASNTTQLPTSATSIGHKSGVVPAHVQHQPQQNAFIPTDEITLLRHFVDFAVPPILVGVEPRWNTSRDALLRLAKSSLPLRHALCAFSALSLGESLGNMPFTTAQSSTYYSNMALNELRGILDEQSLTPHQISHESILASIFFLSYVELIVSNKPKSSLELLDRAHTLLSTKEPSSSTLYHQLQIWLKLLDAKVVSAGGAGIHLHTNPETRDLEAIRETYGSSVANDDSRNGSTGPDVSVLETEEILFNSLNRQAYNFYVQVLNFSGRIARLDKWHRSRGSVEDELEVMLAADKIVRDLNALWTRRPAIIDLVDKADRLRQYMAPSLASKVEQHLRTYTANFYACFIHLQRVAYAHLRAIAQVKSAVGKIVHLSRLTAEDGHVLPVSMLWPLMMAACEVEDEETQGWIIGNIENMKSKVGNAMRTAGLVREIVKRQRSGQRADARTVMQEAFGQVFAII